MATDRGEQSPTPERPFSVQVTLHGRGASIAIDDNAGIGYMGIDRHGPGDHQKFVIAKHLRRTSVDPRSIKKAETTHEQWFQFFTSVKVGDKKTIGEKYELSFDTLNGDSVSLTIRSTNPVVTNNLPRFAGLTSTLKNIHRRAQELIQRDRTI